MSSYYSSTDDEGSRAGTYRADRKERDNNKGSPSIEEVLFILQWRGSDCVQAERHGRRTTLKHIQEDIGVLSPISQFTPLGVGTVLYLQFHFYVIVFVLLVAFFNIPALVLYYQLPPNLSPVPLGCDKASVALYNTIVENGLPIVQANISSLPILLTSTLLNRPGKSCNALLCL